MYLVSVDPMDRSKIIFHGKAKFNISYPIFQGPESFAVQGDYLYTGVQGGDILRLNINDPKKPWEFVTKIGELCQDTHHENICGRPLG